MSCTPYGLAVASIVKKRVKIEKCHAHPLVWPLLPMGQIFKKKKSRLPYGLAHQKKYSNHHFSFCHVVKKNYGHLEKQKNMHIICSGCDCHWAAVIAIGPKKRERPKMSCMPSGLAVVAIGQKKREKQKMSRTPSGLHRLVFFGCGGK